MRKMVSMVPGTPLRARQWLSRSSPTNTSIEIPLYKWYSLLVQAFKGEWIYRQKPVITTQLEALDELRNVQMTLDGTSALAMALSKSGMADTEAVALISCLLEYCSLTVEASRQIIDNELAISHE